MYYQYSVNDVLYEGKETIGHEIGLKRQGYKLSVKVPIDEPELNEVDSYYHKKKKKVDLFTQLYFHQSDHSQKVEWRLLW